MGSASYKSTPPASHAGGLDAWRASSVRSLSSPVPAEDSGAPSSRP